MSKDRHTPDITRTMASAVPRDADRVDDRGHEHLDDRGHIDAREMAGQRRSDEREATGDRPMAMFAGAEAAGYRTQWDAIQTGFVDEPRKAVQEADALVTLVINRLSEVFTSERASLEKQWGKGDEISTEDLRVALRRYRSFFERLLTL
jgi:hypothetical protein